MNALEKYAAKTRFRKREMIMNALEKYAAKKKLTQKMVEGLYGKKPTEGKALRRLGAFLGLDLGGRLGGLAGLGSTRLGRGTFKTRGSEEELSKLITEAKGADIAKLLGTSYGGLFLGGGVGGKAGHMVGKSLDKQIFKKRLAKHTRRKVGVNVGLGGGGLAALLAASKKKDK